MILSPFRDLSDTRLLDEVLALASRERESTAQLIACLAETDARRLYLGEVCSSLFTYCTQVLRLSEHAAYGRIRAARAATTRFPGILDLLADGSITLTTVCLLARHVPAVLRLRGERHPPRRGGLGHAGSHALDARRHDGTADR